MDQWDPYTFITCHRDRSDLHIIQQHFGRRHRAMGSSWSSAAVKPAPNGYLRVEGTQITLDGYRASQRLGTL
jgi:hypothetical protein